MIRYNYMECGGGDEDGPRYASLLACYRSGQMSAARLQRHMREDAAFAAYVERETAKTPRVGATRNERP